MLKQSNGLRLWLECLMITAMLSLMDIETLGSFMHERIGLALGLLVVGHLLLDWRQIKALSQRLLRQDTPPPMRLGALVDILLFAGMLVILLTGLGTSVTIMAQVQLPHRRFFMDLHSYVSYLTLLLMAYHLWLHKNWIRGIIRTSWKRLLKPQSRKAVILWLAALAAVIALVSIGTAQMEHTVLTQGAGNGWQGGRQAAVSLAERPIGDGVYTLADLAQYDGKNGQSAYIAYEGLVYDVSAYFIQGEHHQDVHAGTDLTGLITRRKCLNALNHCPIMGTLTADDHEKKSQ